MNLPGGQSAIPKGWRLVRLGDVAELVMGQSPSGYLVSDWDGSDSRAGGLPFIQGNGEFGATFPKPVKWCSQPPKEALQGDILISVRAPVGETNRVNTKVCIRRGLAAIRFNNCNSAFGWHITNHAKTELERVAQGSTFAAVGSHELHSLSIPLPPLPEQRAIAAVLDSIDEAIEGAEAAIAATEQLRDSLLHQLLTRGVPGWHTEWKEAPGLGTIPAGWEVVQGEAIFKLGGGYGPSDFEFIDNGPALFIKVEDLNTEGQSSYIRTTQLRWNPVGSKFKPIPPPVIVFPKRGAAVFTNRVSIVEELSVVDPNLMTVKALNGMNVEFLRYLLLHTGLHRLCDNSGIPQINHKHLYPKMFPRPGFLEQETIAAMLDRVNGTIDQARKERDGLKLLKESTADALLTGRVRVS